MESFQSDRAPLPRNMIENSMFEEEPDVVDLAKDPRIHPLESDEIEYEPRSSRLLVRGLGEHDLDEDEEDYESSARLLGMSFMNRSSSLRNSASSYGRSSDGSCALPSVRTLCLGAFVMGIIVSVVMVIYFLPKCTFAKGGCHKENQTMEQVYPIATDGRVFPWAGVRLPSSVTPLHYELVLHPNLITMNFSGFVQMTITVNQDTNKIVLHSSGLKIEGAAITLAARNHLVQVLEYPTHNQIAVLVPETLVKGQNCVLMINYTASLSDSYSGFYKSSYKTKTGETRWLAATQFEPVAARTAFPCFDEPDFKATFLIKINREKHHKALSNMPKNVSTPIENGLVQDEFCVSVKMSTYLVAFIVGELQNISKDANGTLVSVYAVPEKQDQIQYALEATVKLLEFYEKYFKINYPLQKLDLVAVPDFQAGAMENWGLITFTETTLLYDNETSSLLDKQIVTIVIAHELAHQWFGNLVTMKWWNDLWLNEGFATFMEYTSIAKTFPDLQADDKFLYTRLKAMAKDSLNSSHPISAKVETSEQVEEMFDSISYEKGASLLLMLKTLLSEDVFQKGTIDYLKTYSYGNTKSDDLWESMNKIKDKKLDVKELMKTWTHQKGCPLVTVTNKGKQIQLRQERYLRSFSSGSSTSDTSYLWQIPLDYMNSSCSSCKNIFILRNKTDTIEVADEVVWIKFNLNMNGYYIVDYGEDGWAKLINLLKTNHTILSEKDRAGLINNIFALASLGRVTLKQALDLVQYLVTENCTAPVVEALSQLDSIIKMVEKRELLNLAKAMKNYTLELFKVLIEEQTWRDEGSLPKQQLRSALLAFACEHEYQACTMEASQMFQKWKDSNGNMSLPTDLMKTVFSVGALTSDGWKFLLDMYTRASSATEKMKILEALASTYDVRKLIWLMQESLQENSIKTQDLPYIIITASKNLGPHLCAWNFVQENWEKLVQKFHLGSFTIQNIITKTTSHFSTRNRLREVQSFFDSLKDKGSQLRIVQEAIETIQLNIQWMDRNLGTLQEWLRNRTGLS
ncbi:leucyl-cystinyl aminopeptidase [Latimeria chalumnae]|uniref:leucyl-cystinyl aminopeptidase n=1 Tax=Latimeria chalumnae TaxID=7897 RepID=UPI00313DF486